MAVGGDHSQVVTYDQLMLIDRVSSAIFCLIHHLLAERCATPLTGKHLWPGQAGFIALVVGIIAIYSVQESAGSPTAAVA